MINAKIEKSTVDAFSINFVQSDYFLCRIQELEQKYRSRWSNWGDFLADYSKGAIEEDNTDLDEWAFLCNHFQQELARGIECGVSPPLNAIYCSEKPESNSGFCFVGAICLMPSNTSQRY